MSRRDIPDLPSLSSNGEDPSQALSRAAHDLNNYCASILGFATLAQESLDPASPLHPYVSEILESARRIAGIATHLRLLADGQEPAPPGGETQ